MLSCLSFSGWVLPPASEAAMPSISRWAAELNPTGLSRCGSSGSFISSAVDPRIRCASQRWDTCSLFKTTLISIIITMAHNTILEVANIDEAAENDYLQFYSFFSLTILVFWPTTLLILFIQITLVIVVFGAASSCLQQKSSKRTQLETSWWA